MGYIYTAKDGDRLDSIVFNHYGTLKAINEVLRHNKHLLNKAVLKAGDEVMLPDIKIKQDIKESKALW